MSIKIVTATLADIDALVDLENSCFTTDRLSKKQYRHFIQAKSALVLVAKQENKVIASATLLFRKNSSLARLYSIAVFPEHQRLGIAQALSDNIEKKMIERKIKEIRLEVRKENIRAVHFYKKNNYTIFGEYKNFYEDGANAIRMRKIISLNNMQLKQTNNNLNGN